jgi:hypothetical protein
MNAPPPAGPPPPDAQNPVTLKVMRLCKPAFAFSLPVPFPPIPPADSAPEPGIALSGMLSLPQSFGDIYLGETFSCYISLCNISPISLAQVGLKVEVQTQLQRETLADSSLSDEAIPRFASQQTLDKIIEYDLKDVGIHILICSALYTDVAGERKYFRKFFKFQVNNPLSMKSKTQALAVNNEVLIETQLQNAMPRQLFLHSVEFKPAPQFEVESLNHFPPSLSAPALGGTALPPLPPAGTGAGQADGATAAAATAAGGGAGASDAVDIADGAATLACASASSASASSAVSSGAGLPAFGHLAFLKAGDTQQYMFRLRGKVSPAQLRQVGTLGRMDVVWRTAMGERGRLQSNTVQRKLPPPRGVEVALLRAPAEVPMETPFELEASVTNTSQAEMQLQLTAPMGIGAMVVDGLCTRNLGALKPNATLPLKLRLIAIEPGVQRVSGMQLIDALTEQVHEIGVLAEVFVHARSE